MKLKKILTQLGIAVVILVAILSVYYYKSVLEQKERLSREILYMTGVKIELDDPLLQERQESFQDGYVFEQYQISSEIMPKMIEAIKTNKSLPNWEEAFAPYWKNKKGSTWEFEDLSQKKDIPLYICGLGMLPERKSPLFEKFGRLIKEKNLWFAYALDPEYQETLDLYVLDEENSHLYLCSGNI